MNVNTTDATTGATALLLPAQNTHTLHDPIRDTEHARAGGVEDGLGVGGLDGGGDVGKVVREEAAGGLAGGRAALAVSRVVGGVGNFRLQTTSNKLQTCRVAGGAVRKPLRVIQHVGLRFPCLCRVSRDIPARTVQSRPRSQKTMEVTEAGGDAPV